MRTVLGIAPRAALGYCDSVESSPRERPGRFQRPGGVVERSKRSSSQPVTRLLRAWRDGDEQALGRLVPLVYEELRALARRELGRERPGHSLQPTELVHDAYARLVDLELSWQDRVHFYRMVARTMRRVLVDHARARKAEKRGGGAVRVTLAEVHGQPVQPASDVLDLAAALDRLAGLEARLSQAVEMFYFGGMTYLESAHALGISPATVDRDLRFARAWLRRALAAAGDGANDGG